MKEEKKKHKQTNSRDQKEETCARYVSRDEPFVNVLEHALHKGAGDVGGDGLLAALVGSCCEKKKAHD